MMLNQLSHTCEGLVAFLYTNNELSESEIKNTIPFVIASKIPRNELKEWMKDVKDLYLENFQTLKKEIEEDANK